MTVRFAFENAQPDLHQSREPISSITRIIDPEPLVQTGKSWTKWLGPAVSLMILAAVAYQLRQMDFARMVALLPSSLGFWIALPAYYFAGPVSEWIIYRRIWSLPFSGFPALLQKLVSNEILLGYLGEVYFYAWARRHTQITTAPFGAIKDVAVLSALAGNLFTLLMVVLSAPLFGTLHLELNTSAFVASTVFILTLSAAMLLLRKRLFTLPKAELWFVALVHSVRIVAMMLLAALLWHLLLPTVALSWWLLLGTVRQLLSRLPFLPNKDVVFAGLATYLVGSDVEIAAAITLFSALILGAHLLVGTFVGLLNLASEGHPE